MNEVSKRTLTIERTFNAPVELVWKAWTDSNHIVKWWGPKGMDIEVVSHDFRVGGSWKYIMPMPDGSSFTSEGTYLEIIEQEKIVTTADMKPMTEDIKIEVLFSANGDKTDFVFNVIHKTEEYCKQQEQMGFYNGWGSAFERLEASLAIEQ
jgi:uncharacterized protein YndB with AHSA1/START domain